MAESALRQPVVDTHIWIDEAGRAWIDDTHIKVTEVVRDYLQGWSAEQIHEQYPHLSLAQIYSALAYYHDHQQELDAQVAREEREAERLRQVLQSSSLTEKLKGRKGS